MGLLAGWASSRVDGAEPGGDEQLQKGHYDQIAPGTDAHGKARWAFARYHLAPVPEMEQAARAAYDKGDELGGLVLLLCHQEGRAVRRDLALLNKINFDLRSRLSKLAKPTPLQLYSLSKTSGADERGAMELPANTTLEEFEKRNEAQVTGWLKQSAEAGFAQACDDLGQQLQKQKDNDKAYSWYERAARLGLASGYRSQGFFLMQGVGRPRDEKAAVAAAQEGARRGDVKAMINMAFYYDRGLGVEKDQAQAQRWIDRAATSGHWYGALEKGMALRLGHYGFAVDKPAALKELQRALDTRNREVLEVLTRMYIQGIGVEPDGEQAVALAEAAHVQGSSQAAAMLAFIYRKGLGKIQADKKLADHWSLQANPSFAFVVEQIDKDSPIARRLQKLDPWAIKLKP
jgi:TPR repeat protein